MNDVETLREAWDGPEPPSPGAQAAARAALMARAAGRRPQRRWAMRAVAVAASAVVIATGTTLVQTVGGGEPTLPAANAQVVLTRIAAAVQKKDFVPPRDDQWIYTEMHTQSRGKGYARGTRFTPQTPLKNTVDEFWTRADGKRIGYMVGGKLMTTNPGVRSPENTYALLAALPTDPDKLLARFREINAVRGADQDDWVFQRFEVTLNQNIVPPAQEAAIFQAMAKLPGVKVDESAVDVEGRPALSVFRVIDGWRKFEILLDPATYAYRGRRETAVADHEERYPQPGVKQFTVKNGKRVPESPYVEWSIERGVVWMMFTRTAVGVVDKAGQKL
ncbi:CU044_5270 family protein [Nonomuraea sp. NPDC026600]|uniref:CU044_5270 family protein n=1 Tax=Nonomuraea sp. NPDC026600 TaxID=3155363 RepID=UPI003405EF77